MELRKLLISFWSNAHIGVQIKADKDTLFEGLNDHYSKPIHKRQIRAFIGKQVSFYGL